MIHLQPLRIGLVALVFGESVGFAVRVADVAEERSIGLLGFPWLTPVAIMVPADRGSYAANGWLPDPTLPCRNTAG